jgi:hypothetical protein
VASKSAQQEPEKAEVIEEMLDALDTTLDRVKVLYEQYFLGIQKQAPSYLHTEVERKLRDLAQMQVRNTALRYRLATLQQKFGSYNNYWRRTLRQIENGTYLRSLSKVGRQAARSGAAIPEEILAAMPKRMREQVKRDRANALAIVAHRTGGEDSAFEHEEGTKPFVDGQAAVIVESSELRLTLRSSRSYVVLEDEEIDVAAMFAEDVVHVESVPAPMVDSEVRFKLRSVAVPDASPEPARAREPRASSGPGVNVLPGPDAAAPRASTAPGVPSRARDARASSGPGVNVLPTGAPVDGGTLTPTAPATRGSTGPGATALRPTVPGASAQGVGPAPPVRVSTGASRASTAPRAAQGAPPAAGASPRTSTGPGTVAKSSDATAVGARPPASTTEPAETPVARSPRIPPTNPPRMPSQVTRPNPIAPGSSARTAAQVETLAGPFPRVSNAAAPRAASEGAPRPQPPPRATTPGASLPPGMTDADVNALYARYVKAKEMVGEAAGPGSYGKLLRTINTQAPKIMEQYKAKAVDFSIVVKDNQVIIRAKPKV